MLVVWARLALLENGLAPWCVEWSMVRLSILPLLRLPLLRSDRHLWWRPLWL